MQTVPKVYLVNVGHSPSKNGERKIKQEQGENKKLIPCLWYHGSLKKKFYMESQVKNLQCLAILQGNTNIYMFLFCF